MTHLSGFALMDHEASPSGEFPQERQTDRHDRALRRRWIEGAVIVVFWGCVALLTLVQRAFDPRYGGQDHVHQGEVLHTFLEYGVWAVLTPFIFWMSHRTTLERGGWQRMLPLSVLVGVTLAVVVDLIDHTLWSTLVPAGPLRPVSVGYIVSRFHFLGEFSLYAALLIAGFARAYFLRFQDKQKEAIRLRMKAAQLQAHLADARLQALRMQINPHFLFNALHSISDSFEGDARTARRMIARLSEVLRYAFEGMDAQEVTLGQELRFLDGYLDVQRFRFEDKLSVTRKIAPDVGDGLVPNMILLPLVENAVKHGLSQLPGPGRIELHAWRESDVLHLRVCDNGPGLAPSSGGVTQGAPGGVGLANTRERLKALYGLNQRCMLEPAPGGGLMVHLSLPFHTAADHQAVAVDEASVRWFPEP